MATHSSILAWKVLWTEEPGGLQSMGSHRGTTEHACIHARILKLHKPENTLTETHFPLNHINYAPSLPRYVVLSSLAMNFTMKKNKKKLAVVIDQRIGWKRTLSACRMSHRELFFFITSHNPHDRPGAGITTTTNLQKLPHRPPVGKDSYTDRQAQSPVLVAFSTNDMQSNNHHRALLLHRLCLLCV